MKKDSKDFRTFGTIPLNIGKFRQAYLKAKAAKKDMFLFNEQAVLTTYAKYVLEYYDTTKGE